MKLLLKLLIPTLLLIGILYAIGFKAHAQEPSGLSCVLVPNPDAGEYKDADGAFIEKAERYTLIGSACPFDGYDLAVYKNWRASQELTLSATPFKPQERVGLVRLR